MPFRQKKDRRYEDKGYFALRTKGNRGKKGYGIPTDETLHDPSLLGNPEELVRNIRASADLNARARNIGYRGRAMDMDNHHPKKVEGE